MSADCSNCGTSMADGGAPMPARPIASRLPSLYRRPGDRACATCWSRLLVLLSFTVTFD